MLTSEQAIIEYRDGKAIPDRLTRKRHGHYIDHVARMLTVYRSGMGQTRRELHRSVENILAAEPDCPVRRVQGFCKLLDDRGTYRADREGRAAKLRLHVFSAAAEFHPLVQRADQLFESDEATIKNRIAQELGRPWPEIEEDLYADVLNCQRLERFDSYTGPEEFLRRYNVAQLQVCLYRATWMVVVATQDIKTMLRYGKLARLLYDVQRLGPGRYRIDFSGPASVLHETRRYGIHFARFLPALLSCSGWSMAAEIPLPWKHRARLELSADDGFQSHLPKPEEFDSSVEESFAAKFGPERNGWRLEREAEVLWDDQTFFVPDFVFRHTNGTQVLMEIVGFWTPQYLAKKRETLRRFKNHKILLAVPEKSIRTNTPLPENVIVYKTAIKVDAVLAALDRVTGESGP